MDATRRERLGDVFERALALPVDQRPAFLERACRDDAELHSELISLLDANAIPIVSADAAAMMRRMVIGRPLSRGPVSLGRAQPGKGSKLVNRFRQPS